MGRRGGRELRGAATVPPVGGNEDGVGEGRDISLSIARLATAGGARNHADGRRLCLGVVFVDEVKAFADKGPLVLERPCFLQTTESRGFRHGDRSDEKASVPDANTQKFDGSCVADLCRGVRMASRFHRRAIVFRETALRNST